MWYYAKGGQQFGPCTEQQMRDLLATRQVQPMDLVWREGMTDWQPVNSVPEWASYLASMGPIPPPLPAQSVESQRLAAGIFALVLGSLGIHKFYLGMPLQGVILLLGTVLTCGMGAMITHVIAVIEGVIYLSKSDADFYQTYVVQKRPWF
jgi:TM2 domain-containing membrane protein YozV